MYGGALCRALTQTQTRKDKQTDRYCIFYSDFYKLKIRLYFLQQVSSNEDASEGRSEDKIAERDLPDSIAECLLQIVCRYVAGYLQSGIHNSTFSNISMLFLLNLRG